MRSLEKGFGILEGINSDAHKSDGAELWTETGLKETKISSTIRMPLPVIQRICL